jgi:hypothetical protein
MPEKQPTLKRNGEKIDALRNAIKKLETDIQNLINDKILNNSISDNKKDAVALQITSKKAEIKDLEIKLFYHNTISLSEYGGGILSWK